jgi:hypothetical protein
MSTLALKELLLLKSNSDEMTRAIQSIPDYVLAAAFLEALEKAEKSKKSSYNSPIVTFGTMMHGDPNTMDMVRDGIGHHVAEYKAALRGGDNRLANTHMRQAMRLINLAQKASAAVSGSKFHFPVKVPDITHWERNRKIADPTRSDRSSRRRFSSGNLSPSELKSMYGMTGEGPDSREDYSPELLGPKMDYGFLRAAPVGTKHGYGNVAYPLQDIMIGGKHIPIEHDRVSSGSYKAHPIDYHPITAIFELPSTSHDKERGPKITEHFVNKLRNFRPHYTNFLKMKMASQEKYGPEGPPRAPVHEEVTPYNQITYFKPSKHAAAKSPTGRIPVESSPAPKVVSQKPPTPGFSADLNPKMRGMGRLVEAAAPKAPTAPRAAPTAPKISTKPSKPPKIDSDQLRGHYLKVLQSQHMMNLHPTDHVIQSHIPSVIQSIHKKTGGALQNKELLNQFEEHPEVISFRSTHKIPRPTE